MPSENNISLAAKILEFCKPLAGFSTHYINKIWCQHKRSSLSFNSKLPFNVTQKMAEINVFAQKGMIEQSINTARKDREKIEKKE